MHATNADRLPEDIVEMDAIIKEYPYFKSCLTLKQCPVFIEKTKTLSGQVPQRLIFDGSSCKAKIPLHSKCTWLINLGYSVQGVYLKRIYSSISKVFNVYDYYKQYYGHLD